MGVPGKILCVLMLLLHSSIQQQVFNDEETLHLPANYTISWMETLDDQKLISDITLPGTHESLALHGGFIAECQAWSLEDQLKAGIRFFDFRVVPLGKKLLIMHGPVYQSATLKNALKTIKTFLSKYKSETVLVRVKPVLFLKNKVPLLVENMAKNDPDCWTEETIPNIGQVRGKIVFVQKNAVRLGIRLYETDRHNDYIVTNVEKKIIIIINHLNDTAYEQYRAGWVVLNYSSGTGIPRLSLTINPKSLAKQINPWLYKHLNNESKKTNPKPCFGVIAMDFPGLDLIKKVTEFN
ncbi:1-phosphatidylinositol phosphodiesterase-like [Sinocyclocheilus grahami]|nr:PREDICTED: 1-phosphatidylinositol phosphodiesterase-like [Sinocyclocheilus grahami]